MIAGLPGLVLRYYACTSLPACRPESFGLEECAVSIEYSQGFRLHRMERSLVGWIDLGFPNCDTFDILNTLNGWGGVLGLL